MKRLSVLWIIVCILAFSFTVPVSAENRTVTYRNAKTLGMGNAKIAGGYGYNGFIDNPALLSRVHIIRLSVINLPITINKHALDIGKFIDDNQDKFENFDELSNQEMVDFLDDVQKYDGKWAHINLSPLFDIAFSLPGQSLGLAVYNTTDVSVKVDRGIYEPRVWGKGTSDLVAVLGYARPLTMLYPGLTVGVNLKYIQRRRASLFQIKATDLGDIQEIIEPVTEEVKEEEKNTFAVDVGALWDIPFIDTEVGATIQSIGDGKGASVDIGASKRFLSDNLTLLADYIDFFDNNKENVFNKLHIGAEYKMQTIAFRTGINSGYPVVGMGLDFRIIDIDAAYFFDELSNAPGVNEDTRYIVQLKFGW